MALVAIHRVRTAKGAPLEPVGVWIVEGVDAAPYYPPQHEKYAARAWKALMERPLESLEQWVTYKANSSPSWHLYEPTSLFNVGHPEAPDIYDEVHHQYSALVDGGHVRLADAARDPSAFVEEEESPSAGRGANRFAIAQSWWIASELVRRHPELIVYEMHPGGGQYDVLCVATPDQLSPAPQEQRPRIMLNRVGTIQIHHGDHFEVVADWPRVLEQSNPHAIVKEIEGQSGWGSPATLATTERSLAYRFLSTALTMLINDRHRWDVRSESLDTVDGLSRRRLIDPFPSVLTKLDETPRLGIHSEPYSHHWALLRGEQPVIIVSMEGMMYTSGGGTMNLMEAYKKAGRQLIPMTATVLTEWL